MIEPGESALDCFHRRDARKIRSTNQDHREPKLAGGRDLAVTGLTAAVLGDDHLDAVCTQQSTIILHGKGTAIGYIGRMWNWQRRIDRIDAAHQVVMLRSCYERREILAAERHEHAPRMAANGTNSLGNIRGLDPAIARDRRPRRPSQSQQRDAARRGSLSRVGGDQRRVGMCGIDQNINALSGQIRGEPVSATKTADTHRNRLGGRCRRATGKRQNHRGIGPCGKTSGQSLRFRGTAKNEDSHVGF
jgi:hypothetical protein